MADKSFGVKELNLLNASGTPTVTSPNNLNLNANTVAISTSATVGNNLTITSTTTSANVNVTGIATVVNFNATGISTIAQPSNTNAHSLWLVTANGSSAYRFTGPGQDGSDDDPDVYLVRGQRYIFTNNSGGSHPFQIRVASGGAAYSTGVTNNGASSGNIIFNVQHDAPAQLFYQCTSHSGMVGNIYIVGGPQVVSGVITATSFSGSGANLTSLPAQATIANNGNDRIITGGSGVNLNGEANLQFDGTDLYVSDNIKHLGDPDTLIEFATDTITFDTAGSERLRIASDGATKVCHNGGAFGVGGDSINKFGITASDNNFFGLHRSNASTGTGEFNINVESNSQVTFSMDDEGAFSFGTSTDPSAQSGYSEKLRIASDGTTTFDPSAGGTLKVGGSSAHTSKIVIADNGGTGNGNCLVEGGDGTDFFTIQSNGNVAFENGKGINFGASAGSNASSSILDDYEEGSFTFVRRGFASGFDSNYQLANQTGKYTKIGRQVLLKGGFNLTGNSGNIAASNYFTVTVGGLPFAIDDSSSSYSGAIISHQGSWWAYTSLGGGSNAKGSVILVYNDYLSFYCTSVTGSPVRNSNEITFTISYTTT